MIAIDKRERLKAYWLVGFQAVIAAILALSGLLFGQQIALSLLSGGLIGVAGSVWMAGIAFRHPSTRPAKEILASFYLGAIGKFLIVMILFIVAFKQFVMLREPHNALMLFLAFVVSQIGIAIAPYLLRQD